MWAQSPLRERSRSESTLPPQGPRGQRGRAAGGRGQARPPVPRGSRPGAQVPPSMASWAPGQGPHYLPPGGAVRTGQLGPALTAPGPPRGHHGHGRVSPTGAGSLVTLHAPPRHAAAPHSPPSPCGQPRHAPQARQRPPARGQGDRGVSRVRGLGGRTRRGDTYRDARLSRGASLPQLSSSALHRPEGPECCPPSPSLPSSPGCRPTAPPSPLPLQVQPGVPLPPPAQRSHLPVLPSRPWTPLDPGGPAHHRQASGLRSTPQGAPRREHLPPRKPRLRDPRARAPPREHRRKPVLSPAARWDPSLRGHRCDRPLPVGDRGTGC